MRLPSLCIIALLCCQSFGTASARQQTPPLPPKTVDTPVPPPVTLPSPPALPAEVPDRPLTADEAARIALRLQPNILIARANILAAQGRTQQVRSGLLPTVSLSGSYTNVQSLSGTSGTGVVNGGGGGTGVGTGSTGGGSGTGFGTGTGGTGSGSTGGVSGGGTGTGGSIGGTGSGGTGSGSTGGTGMGGASGGTGGTSGTGSTGPTTVTQLGASNGLQTNGFLASATVRQLIFDFSHTRDLVRQSAALERVVNQNLTRTQYDLVLQVKQAFYFYNQNTRLVTVNEQNVANRQSQLALAAARLNVGLGQPADVATAQTAVSEAIAALTVARANAEFARIDLALYMGIDPRIPLRTTATDEADFPSNDVNGLVTVALRQRPEILAARATIQANESGLSAARTTNAPVVSGSLGVTSRGDQFLPKNDSFSVGVSIAFSPYDGGLTSGRVKEARANLTSARAEFLATQQGVTADVAQAYISLRTAEQRVATANNEVTNATEGVRIAEGRYRTGLGLFQDIITAQAQLLTAQTDLVNAQGAVNAARAAINRAVGNPLPVR